MSGLRMMLALAFWAAFWWVLIAALKADLRSADERDLARVDLSQTAETQMPEPTPTQEATDDR